MNMPPFLRVLKVDAASPMSGDDVKIVQFLAARCIGKAGTLVSGLYDNSTAAYISELQTRWGVDVDGVFGPVTSANLLEKCYADGYKDDGLPASARSSSYLYKIVVPVHRNRTVETNATLFDAHNTPLHTFVVRAHGYDTRDTKPWPDFNNVDAGMNEFAGNGNTPTGLSEVDFNSPEDDPKSFGPYDVNRITNGLEGNMLLLLPNIRYGLLLHTGDWPQWTPSQPMPNSAGCLHAHPQDIKLIMEILTTKLGVNVRVNPQSGKGYPYKSQGLISVYQIED